VTKTLSIDRAAQDLQTVLQGLHLGETVTLVGNEGAPEALLVSLRARRAEHHAVADWDERWDELANRIGDAWQGEKSAVEILSEMRR
jgi:hypothetical protein